jgi:uncharacterized protein (DUF927 family)
MKSTGGPDSPIKSELLEAALAYAALGWSVIPLQPREKKPALKWEKYQRERADAEQIKKWWKRWPDANVGIVTGAVSGVIVLDVDGEEGRSSLKGKYLPRTCCAKTGGGGEHYLYKHPGVTVANFAGKLPGLDLRGDGGYIAAPPSVHPSGASYEWSLPPEAEALHTMPDWLAELIHASAPAEQVEGVDPRTVLAGVEQGRRDSEIFRYAASLRARGIRKEEAQALVLRAAAACSPPFPEEEALAKVDSAWRYEEGTTRERELKTARKKLEKVTADTVFDDSNIEALVEMKTKDPAFYAKIKQSLKGKISLRDLEAAVSGKLKKTGRGAYEDGEDHATFGQFFNGCPAPYVRVPPGWSVTDAGVYKKDPDGGGKTEVCMTPVLITGKMENVTTGQAKLTLAFKEKTGWKKLTAPRAKLASNISVVGLADKGLPVYSHTAKLLVKYLADLERANAGADTLETHYGVSRLGWVNSDTFFPGAENGMVVDVDEATDETARYYSAKGSLKDWMELTGELRNHLPARAILAAGFASPLLSLMRERVFIVHVWGASLSGKTAAGKAALSVWGRPDKLIADFSATQAGVESLAGLAGNLPMLLDERQVKKEQNDLDSLIYILSTGKGKTRSTLSGGLQPFHEWHNIIISTGEYPLTGDLGAAGTQNRVLELTGPIIPDREYAGRLHRELTDCYGTAGPAFIKKVMREPPGVFKNDYENLRAYLKNEAPEEAHVYLGYTAALMAGDFYSSRYIFNLDEKTAYEEALALGFAILEGQKKDVDLRDELKAKDYMDSWIGSNIEFFLSEPPGGRRFGWIEEGCAVIYLNIFKEFIEKAGFNERRVLRDWAEKGFIKVEVSGGQKHLKIRKYDNNAGKQIRVVAFVRDEG